MNDDLTKPERFTESALARARGKTTKPSKPTRKKPKRPMLRLKHREAIAA